ncbi:MAG TPA: glycosyltransferase family 2 protein [Clostridiales bacterium]|nr:glycosyltransferase family 2 protein [Clostridiales bacterium]HQK72877.1 glycosyltransferase family 2 protein [Clostridiales bacterium]
MNKRLYIVIPCYNEQDVLRETAERLRQKVEGMIANGLIAPDSRVLFVDDGSKDATWAIIRQLNGENRLFTGFRLSRNVGQQKSLFAGMVAVKDLADMAVSMDADLQDDIDVMEQMIQAYYRGDDIVFGVRSSRKKDSLIRKLASEGFYLFTRMLGIRIVPDHAHYRLMSRRAIEALAQYSEVNLFLPFLVPQLGFRHSIVYYERNKRFAGKTKYSLRKLFSMAVDGITSFSTKPIELISIPVFLSFLAAFGGCIAMLALKARHDTIPEWLPVFSSLWFVAAFQLLAIRIIGEYIGKTFKETKRRPRYFIAEKLLDDIKHDGS